MPNTRLIRIQPKHDLTHAQMARKLRLLAGEARRANFLPLASTLEETADTLVEFDRQSKAMVAKAESAQAKPEYNKMKRAIIRCAQTATELGFWPLATVLECYAETLYDFDRLVNGGSAVPQPEGEKT